MTETRWLGKVGRIPWRYSALDTWNRFCLIMASQSPSDSGKVRLPEQDLAGGDRYISLCRHRPQVLPR